MINYVLLMISLCLGVLKNVLSKVGKKDFDGLNNLMSVNIITSVSAVLVFLTNGISPKAFADSRFVLLALLYGLLTLGSQSLYIVAVKNGSVAVCSLIYASCFIIPTLYTAIAFKEPVSWLRALGILIMIISVFLVCYQKTENTKKSNNKYLIPILLAMLCAGSVGILQKLFGHIYNGNHYNEYLFLSFSFMLLLSLIFITVINKKEQLIKHSRKFYIIALILSLSIVFANKLNIILVKELPGLIFFPIINGGCIMLSTIMSMLFFNEKLSKSRIFGISVGIIAIILIAM